MTSNSDLLQDVEDGFLSAAGERGNSALRKKQFEQFGRVREPALVVDGAAEVQPPQRVA